MLFIERVSIEDAVDRRQAPFPADVTVSASWQLHYLLHQSAVLFPFASSMYQLAEAGGRKRDRVEGKGEKRVQRRKAWKMAARSEGTGTREEEMVSLKQSRWLVALDRNPVYRIMSVCPRCMCPYTYIRTATYAPLPPARVL